MNKQACSLLILLFLVLGSPTAPRAAGALRNNPEDLLLGEWTIPGKDGLPDGEAVFRSDGTYDLKEHRDANLAVTLSGRYKLDAAQEPFAVDLCVGECGVPGSEWTTTFGLLRFLSDDEVEILYDPNGKRPAAFPESDEGNVLHLIRQK
jgi:hypothetical protein